MVWILSIDASTVGCSVALFSNNILISRASLEKERSASEMLTTLIDNVLKEAVIGFSDLSAIAVAKGPGSYTGLRIAVSTAKGMAFALNIPLISYGSLEAMLRQVKIENFKGLLCPMLDARRMEVYMGLYDSETFKLKSGVEACIVNENLLAEKLVSNKVLFFGEGSGKCKDLLISKNANFYEFDVFPSAEYSGEITYNKYLKKEFENLQEFEPHYLKEYMFKTKKKP